MSNQKDDAVGKLYDLLTHIDVKSDPFLYYLPQLVTDPKQPEINPENAVSFTELALSHDKLPIVADALKILNSLINSTDGSLITPSRNLFYDNRSFFWDELGGHTSAIEVISHIFNNVIFQTSLGKN
jgi:hypothetical protein